MEASCWSDYLCPWCYVGQHRSATIEGLGLAVVHRPYELHPEIGPEGHRIRPDGRLGPTFARVAAECEQIGLPFTAPTRMPNTRRALETAEWVRAHAPDAFGAVHRGLFHAHFAAGEAIDDQLVLDRIVAEAGADPEAVRAGLDAGEGRLLVEASMAEARELGVTSTPTWVLPGGLVVPGALDASTIERWVRKILARAQERPSA